MEEVYKLLIGTGALIIGFFIGNFLAHATKEELKGGQKWFRLIIILSLIGTVCGLIFASDSLLFSFAFIAIVTSRSLRK
ncbi:MAG TPA: hypothetical protein VMC07_02205 [Candidatus Omnitrophota bacterium]|nr:hypothetical protein [Candidatus Omnitrophota bacterium]